MAAAKLVPFDKYSFKPPPLVPHRNNTTKKEITTTG
jgi:hypothetical protein